MSEMNRREFLAGTAQAVGGVLTYSLLGETPPAEGATTAEPAESRDEPVESFDEDFWVGGY